MSAVEKTPSNCHVIEVRRESYGYTVAHRCNDRVVFVATYPNGNEALRVANLIAEREQADGHEVIMFTAARLS